METAADFPGPCAAMSTTRRAESGVVGVVHCSTADVLRAARCAASAVAAHSFPPALSAEAVSSRSQQADARRTVRRQPAAVRARRRAWVSGHRSSGPNTAPALFPGPRLRGKIHQRAPVGVLRCARTPARSRSNAAADAPGSLTCDPPSAHRRKGPADSLPPGNGVVVCE